MTEFEIDGKQFRFERLSAMQQFHVSRKIAPLIPPLMPVFVQVQNDVKRGKRMQDELEILGPMLQPLADGLAGMKDEDAEFVFNACLSVMRYKHGENWIAMWNSTGKVAMVMELNDISLLLRLVVRVIVESLASFMQGFVTSAEPTAVELRSVHSPEAKTG